MTSENCVLCGEKGQEDRRAKFVLNERFIVGKSVLCCCKCGLRWIFPYLSKEELENFYSSEYFEMFDKIGKLDLFLSNVFSFLYFFERAFKIKSLLLKLKGNKKSFRLFDIGCGYGIFLEVSKLLGFDVFGIDISDRAVQEVRKKGIPVEKADFLSFDTERKFDAIHANHVFEHFTDPHIALKRISKFLDRPGILCLEIPNQFDNIWDLLRFYLKKPYSSKFFALQHPFFWSEKSIKKLLHIHGFKMISVRKYERIDFVFRAVPEVSKLLKVLSRFAKIPFAILSEILKLQPNIEVLALKI